MPQLSPVVILASIGLLAYVVLFVLWKKGAARWAQWFPLFQKVTQYSLIATAIGLVIAAAIQLRDVENIRMGLGALVFGLGIIPLVNLVSGKKGPSERHERGASVAKSTEVRAMIKKEKQGFDLEWGKVPIPHGAEPYHFLVAGSTGAGKSVAITALLDMIRKRGDTAIIVDSGGEFMSRYWQPETDFVLNPFDDRCAPWSPTGDLEGPWDAEALSRSIIPDGTGEQKEWNGYAQTLVASCMQSLWDAGRKALGDLLYAVQAAPMAELAKLLAGTPAAAQLGSDKTFGSIRTIASKYMTAYSYLISSDQPFSVAKFIRESKNGFLYLTYRDDQLDSLRNLISCVLDIAARTILSLQPNGKRRVWLVIDEFASIGKVQSIEAVATKARKVGGCLVVGIQSISQLKERYGEHAAQSILSCLSTWVVLRCADPDTAEYMSKYMGEEQIVRTSEGSSSSDSGGSKSWNEQTSTQRVILASEIQKLANVQGYLKIAGHYPVCHIKLEFPPRKENAVSPFVLRDFEAKPMMKFHAPAESAPEQQVAQPVSTSGGSGMTILGANRQSGGAPSSNQPTRIVLLRRTQTSKTEG